MKKFAETLQKTMWIALLLFLNATCTETFEFEAEEFENILVIEGNITDEVGPKEIRLSRTFLSGEESITESGAQVVVEDDQGVAYTFQEQEPGRYISELEFGASAGRSYTLKLNTTDGDSYSSSPVSLPASARIERLEAVRTTKDGEDGVAIVVNSAGDNAEPSFYRYAYEETYKIVTFYNPSKELLVVSESPPVIEIVDKTREEQICFKTILSNSIAIANSSNFEENSISDFQIRFIKRLSRLVTDRYSILVTQFSQSREANTFYKNLKEFSSIESLFSQTQPGFITSNISSEADPDEKVLGFFEITSVSSQRIFFDFQDIFGNATRFFPDCDILDPSPSDADLVKLLNDGTFDYASELPSGAPLVAPIACVDCNVLGTNVVPDFWEDE
ncbi:DUF4249 domain-containing protein [Maribacter sp.]|nr:DUF4249 domain-containing protein [Maribacter sp.]